MIRKFAAALLLLGTSALAADSSLTPSPDDLLVREGRILLAREYPDVLAHVFRKDGFGGPPSPLIAQNMLTASPDRVAAAKKAMTVERHGNGMWLLRFPYVNVAVIETRRGLVVFDTGYAAIGPVLAEVLRRVAAAASADGLKS